MGDDNLPAVEAMPGPFRDPWPALFTGIAAAGLGCLWAHAVGFEGWKLAIGLPLLLAGLAAAGVAAAIRPQSSMVLALVSLCGWLSCLTLYSGADPQRYDSARLLLGFLASVAAAAALIMLLPRTARRIVFSLLILFHFGGIITAASTVAPAPWLAMLLWSRVYRPYLEFMYLNNAYHFYSPEPGPGDIVWFYVKYEDGTIRRFDIPNREDNALVQEYTRRLSMTQHIKVLMPLQTVPDALIQARMLAAQTDGIPVADAPALAQYTPPQEPSKLLLSVFARYVAHAIPHETDPSKKATSVKIYRVVHRILYPQELARGDDPSASWTFLAFYQGEYDPEGKLLDPSSPYLYWLIPILKVPRAHSHNGPGPAQDNDQDWVVENYVEKHLHLGDRAVPKPEGDDQLAPPPG
jgi:hypothetical protein